MPGAASSSATTASTGQLPGSARSPRKQRRGCSRSRPSRGPDTGLRATSSRRRVARQIEGGAGRNAGISRRTIFGAAAGVGLAGAAGLGLWSIRARDDRRFDALVRRGAVELEYGDDLPEAAKYFRQAVAIRPDDAGAQGMLAFALMTNAELVSGAASEQAVDDAEQAARRSLQLDPTDANARLALTQLQLSTLDLAGTEDRLRGVLATAPNNIFAMGLLWSSASVCRPKQRSAGVRPTGNRHQAARRIEQLPLGSAAMDRRAESRSRPDHRSSNPILAHASLRSLCALHHFRLHRTTTRRSRYARRRTAAPRKFFRPLPWRCWRISLAALDQPTPANVARAREANLDEAKGTRREPPKRCSLCPRSVKLTLRFRGRKRTPGFPSASCFLQGDKSPQRAGSTAWRFTPWLFTPPAAALRADARFGTLCDGTGLTDYWTKRGIKPDYQRV